jgi:hypothetical protein
MNLRLEPYLMRWGSILLLALVLGSAALAAPATRVSGRVVLMDEKARVRIAPDAGEKIWVRDPDLQAAAKRLGMDRIKEDMFYLWVDVRLEGPDPQQSGKPGYFIGHLEVEGQPVSQWLEP